MSNSSKFTGNVSLTFDGNGTSQILDDASLDDLCRNFHVSFLIEHVYSLLSVTRSLVDRLSLHYLRLDRFGEYFGYSSIELFEKTS